MPPGERRWPLAAGDQKNFRASPAGLQIEVQHPGQDAAREGVKAAGIVIAALHGVQNLRREARFLGKDREGDPEQETSGAQGVGRGKGVGIGGVHKA